MSFEMNENLKKFMSMQRREVVSACRLVKLIIAKE